MRIIFHGENAASFSAGFADLVGGDAEIAILPDALASDAERSTYAAAEVIIGSRFNATLPRPEGLRLFHVAGAGIDAVDLVALPGSAVVCNCFGHEQAIAEYVMAAILARNVPLAAADADLRKGFWTHQAGAPERVHGELSDKTIGLLGFGHIGKAIAARAKAFEMKVTVANRSPPPASAPVDRWFPLAELASFWGSADVIVVSLPLTPETAGIVGREAFAAMRSTAVVINVGRGATVDETALYEALCDRRIAGAVIDTWYRYPSPGDANPLPSRLPFHELPNVIMTPHMSAWTTGTIRRRQRVMAENIRRVIAGEFCLNVVRPAAAP
jgi:phosphoglycerate dehydrogenase-like enzyme